MEYLILFHIIISKSMSIIFIKKLNKKLNIKYFYYYYLLKLIFIIY